MLEPDVDQVLRTVQLRRSAMPALASGTPNSDTVKSSATATKELPIGDMEMLSAVAPAVLKRHFCTGAAVSPAVDQSAKRAGPPHSVRLPAASLSAPDTAHRLVEAETRGDQLNAVTADMCPPISLNAGGLLVHFVTSISPQTRGRNIVATIAIKSDACGTNRCCLSRSSSFLSMRQAKDAEARASVDEDGAMISLPQRPQHRGERR